MSKSELGISTAQALRLTGIDPLVWQNAVGRGDYTNPPSGSRGKPRVFYPDDLAALRVFELLLEYLVPPGYAARVAAAFREELRRSNTPRRLCVWKVVEASGKPGLLVAPCPPEEGSKELWRFNVPKLRREARKAIAERLAREADDG